MRDTKWWIEHTMDEDAKLALLTAEEQERLPHPAKENRFWPDFEAYIDNLTPEQFDKLIEKSSSIQARIRERYRRSAELEDEE